jgi:hypothetical protein
VADDTGPLLLRAGLIDEEQLHVARQMAASGEGTLGEYLVLSGTVDDEQLTALYRNRLMVPRVEQRALEHIPGQLIARIPKDMAVELRVIPVSIDRDGNLVLAMSDPTNSHAVDEITFFTGSYVVRAVATQRQIAWCLATYYGHVTPLAQRAGSGEAAGRDRRVPGTGDPGVAQPPAATPPEPESEPEAVEIEALPPEFGGAPAPASSRAAGAGGPPISASGELDARQQRPAPLVETRLPAVVLEDDLLLDAPPAAAERTPGDAPGDEAGDEVILLATPKTTRPGRDTDRGTGFAAVNRNATHRDPAQPAQAVLDTGAVPHPTGEDERRTSRFERVRVIDTEEFGPPGSTIPPPFLGIQPELDEEESADQRARASSEITAVAPVPRQQLVDDDLDSSSRQLLTTMRKLDGAASRDEVIGHLLDHLNHSFGRVAFFAIKGGALHPWQIRDRSASQAPAQVTLGLDQPSLLAEVVRSQKPYRGELPDDAARDFLAALVPDASQAVLAVPVLLRGRAVGLLYADQQERRLFDEHLAVITRSAALALERILVQSKR